MGGSKVAVKWLPKQSYGIINTTKYCVAPALLKQPRAWTNLIRRFVMDTLPLRGHKSNHINILFPPADKTYRHYVYTLAYPDGKVFYVGKGTGDRIHMHEYEALGARKSRNIYKTRVINKIWREGGEIFKTKLAFFQTNEEALAYETALIFFTPDLTNLTDGGEGNKGYKYTEEQKAKIRGRKLSEERLTRMKEGRERR